LVITTLVTGKKLRKLWSSKVEAFNFSKQVYQDGDKIDFQLVIPPEIKMDGRTILSPPSLLVKAQNVKIVVDYRLVVSLGKKGILRSAS
jgi:hypothetical protein